MSLAAKSHAVAEQPILWLGLAGFAPEDSEMIGQWLARPPGQPRWQVGEPAYADAWLAYGGDARVPRGAELKPRCLFDPTSRAALHRVLLQFETGLRDVRARFELGAAIIRMGTQLRGGVFHVSHRGSLLAVLDFNEGRAGIAPQAHPVDLREAAWNRRPLAANDIPTSFLRTTPAQLAWGYVQRAGGEALPERYRHNTIFYRRSPRVPMEWLRESQRLVLRELSSEPSTHDMLRRRTGLSESALDLDLACLYFAGAITTTQAKAAGRTSLHDSLPSSAAAPLEAMAGTHEDAGVSAPAALA